MRPTHAAPTGAHPRVVASLLDGLARLVRAPLAAVLVAALLIGAQIAGKAPRYPAADELGYIDIALDLVTSGIYTDGSIAPEARRGAPGMFFAPAMPAYLAGLMAFEPTLLHTIACQRAAGKAARALCPADYGTFLWVQGALAALSLFLVWIIACQMRMPLAVAWLALLLVAASGRYAYYAVDFLTETPLILAFSGFTAALLAAAARPALRRWLLVGALAGVCALIRPDYLYLAEATAAAVAVWLWAEGRGPAGALAAAAASVAGTTFIVLPWMVRNALVLHHFALTDGYGAYILAQRVSYDMMSWREWAMGWIYWLPDFGDTLAAHLFGKEAFHRLSFFPPDSFYQVGNGRFLEETAAAAAAAGQDHLSFLLDRYVLGAPFKHAAVTLVLAWRGLWVAKYYSLVGVLLSLPAWAIAARRGQVRGFLLLAMPGLFMLGLHAFVSVNVPRYNIVLLPFMMIAASYVLDAAARWLRRRVVSLWVAA